MAITSTIQGVILTKRVNQALQELYAKTHESLVVVGSGTLTDKLAAIDAAAKTVSDTLKVLLPENGTASASISSMIETAIADIKKAVTDEDTPTTIAARLKALETTVSQLSTSVATQISTAISTSETGIYNSLGWTKEQLGTTSVKAYIDGKEETIMGKISGVLHYKGTKTKKSELTAIQNPETGDVWFVSTDDTGDGDVTINAEFAWDGSKWEELGRTIDLSTYATKSYAESLANNAKVAADAAQKDITDYKTANDKKVGDLETKVGTVEQTANSAKSTAEQAAADLEDLEEQYETDMTDVKQAVQNLNTLVDNRARFFVSAELPAGLAETDLWAHIIDTSINGSAGSTVQGTLTELNDDEDDDDDNNA